MTDLDDHEEFRSYLDGLASPISELSGVITAICTPLHALSLLPRTYEKYNIHPFRDASESVRIVLKRLSSIHSALMSHVLPVWYPQLVEERHNDILLQLFAPEPVQSQYAGIVGLTAFTSLSSHPIRDFSVDLLSVLIKRYPVEVVYRLTSGKTSVVEYRMQTTTWEEYIRCIFSVPTKVSNWSSQHDGTSIPKDLEMGYFFKKLCVESEGLIAAIASVQENYQRISSLLSKFVTSGLFTTTASSALPPSQASFFVETLPSIRKRLQSSISNIPKGREGASVWPSIMRSLSRSQRVQIAKSLIANLDEVADNESLSESDKVRGVVSLDAMILGYICGGFGLSQASEPDDDGDDGELWDVVSATVLAKHWGVFHARVFVCWFSGCGDVAESNVKALEMFLDRTLELWGDATFVRHSTFAEHKYVSSLLLLTLSAIKSFSLGEGPSLHFNPAFIKGINHYLSHLDPAVRRCGMLAAEIAATQTGKELSFGGWDDDGPQKNESNEWRVWARGLRQLVQSDTRDWDIDISKLFKEIPDGGASQTNTGVVWGFSTESPKITVRPEQDSDDDSLVGYDSDDEVTRSRTPSPTPSELDELEHDPTIHVGRKRIRPPVYLVDLGAMLREKFDITGEEANNKGGDDNAEEKAEAVRIALEHAEDMIRRRRTFGAELDECAVDLVHALVAMRNNFELDNFDEQRQKALIALVACSPRKAPPAIAEELFKNQYSVDQRYVMFNALALGARELAGLPVAGTPDVDQRRLPTFPSKMLPPGLHARYVDEDDAGGTLALLSGSLQSLALGDNSGGQEVSRPRERRLRSAPSATGRITAITPKEAGQLSRPVQSPYDKPMESFTAVSVECFLGPLMGRFWNFVRDEQTRESRSSLSSSSDPNTRYRAAGTGMVLSPLVLAHLLRTVSVLVHASRHSLLFMAVVAPDALEMAVVLGTRPVSGWDSRDSKEREQEASVLHSSLELALITLDACLSIDGGRILAMEHSALILGVEEWAMRAVQELDKGIKFGGTGGAMESKLGRVAAGVVVKIDEVVGKWRRVMSMIGD